MTVSEVIAIVSVLIAFLGFTLTLKNTKRNDTSDVVQKAKDDATINVKLDSALTTLTDIKYDVSATKKEVSELSQRMAGAESSIKSAHHRLDNLEERINP